MKVMVVEEKMNVLALMPINEIKIDGIPVPYTPHVGSIKIDCENCGTACWIGPRQTAVKLESPEMPALCMLCVCKEMKKQKDMGEEVIGTVIPLGN